MEGEPVFQTGFVAHEQCLETVEPRVHLLNDELTAVEFGIQQDIIVGLPVRCAPVAWNIGLYRALGAVLTQAFDIEGFVRIEKEPGQTQLGLFEQIAEFGKHLF